MKLNDRLYDLFMNKAKPKEWRSKYYASAWDIRP
jgi:hypothetical protein